MRRVVVDEEEAGRGEGGQVYLVAPFGMFEEQLDDALLPRFDGRGCAATSVRG